MRRYQNRNTAGRGTGIRPRYKLLALARGRIGSGSASHRQVEIKLTQRGTASVQLRSPGSQHDRREPPELEEEERIEASPHLTSHPRRTQPQAICQGTSKAAGSRNLISPAKHGAQTPDPTTTRNSQWPDPDRRELRGEAARRKERRKGEGPARTHLVRLRSAARVRGSGSGGSRSDGNVAVEGLVSGGGGSGSVEGWGVGEGDWNARAGAVERNLGKGRGKESRRARRVGGRRPGAWRWRLMSAGAAVCRATGGLLARQVSPLTPRGDRHL